LRRLQGSSAKIAVREKTEASCRQEFVSGVSTHWLGRTKSRHPGASAYAALQPAVDFLLTLLMLVLGALLVKRTSRGLAFSSRTRLRRVGKPSRISNKRRSIPGRGSETGSTRVDE